MTAAAAPRAAAASRPDPRAVFRLRVWARAKLFAAGELGMGEAVDGLQAAAERDGLVAELGQDAVQAIIADAFLVEMPDGERKRNAPELPPPPPYAAPSTIAAAKYLVMQGDAERLRQWLAEHSAEERAAIRGHLETRQWPSHSEK